MQCVDLRNHDTLIKSILLEISQNWYHIDKQLPLIGPLYMNHQAAPLPNCL